MREIEFRGKNKCDNNWHYGYLVYEPKDSSYKITQGKETSYFVEENTIEEYTGLKDKNGTKIFEGDIIQADYDGCPYYSIAFEDGAFRLNNYTVLEYFRIKECGIRVVGNIHDNPELMGGD